MEEKMKFILKNVGRVAALVLCLPLLYFRMINVIPLIVGILFVWRDGTRFGQIIGWVLAFGSFGAALVFYIIYSVEGGLLY